MDIAQPQQLVIYFFNTPLYYVGMVERKEMGVRRGKNKSSYPKWRKTLFQKIIEWCRSIKEPYKSWLKANYRFFLNLKNRLIRWINPPSPPENNNGDINIRIGCGIQDDDRYINIDAVPFPHVHHVQTAGELEQFESNSVDLIYACHVLEHISHQYTKRTLEEWNRVLKKGGTLRLAVPDFDRLLSIYQEEGRTIESILPLLMGVQDAPVNAHRAVFNEQYLAELLRETGFSEVQRWAPEESELYSFDDFASHQVERTNDDSKTTRSYPFSLNLEGIK